MAMSTLLLLLLLLTFLYYHFVYKRRGFPPGPTPWPLIGNFAQMDLANPHRTILKWREIYGPVFTIWLPKPIVVLANREVLEEALVKQGDTYAARPSSFLYRMFTGTHHEGDGIILSSGERWQTQRQFALKTLKTFGFGRGEMEGRINFHLDRLLEQIEGKFYRRQTSIQDPHEPLAFCVGNIIQDIVMGKVYDFGDPEFKHFKYLIDTVLAQVQSVQLLIADCFPYLARLLPGYHAYYRHGMALQNFFLKEIDKHEKVLSSEGLPRDFIEAYLREWRRQPGNRNFSKLTLALNSGDLWTGGMETTVTTIRWGIIYLLHYPDVQEGMRDEILKVIGVASRVQLSDRLSLPYCSAVIAELQRLANVLPWNIPHCTSAASTVGGFSLPAGTDIMPHIGAVHHDPALFPDPERFDPQRFIDADGNFCVPIAFSPFGIGRRACLGENLAKMELFLIFVTLVQRYRFSVYQGGSLPSLARRMGMASVPGDFECKWERVDEEEKTDEDEDISQYHYAPRTVHVPPVVE